MADLQVTRLSLWEIDAILDRLRGATVGELHGPDAVAHIFGALNELRGLRVVEMRERGELD
jgi:hypothetical protein